MCVCVWREPGQAQMISANFSTTPFRMGNSNLSVSPNSMNSWAATISSQSVMFFLYWHKSPIENISLMFNGGFDSNANIIVVVKWTTERISLLILLDVLVDRFQNESIFKGSLGKLEISKGFASAKNKTRPIRFGVVNLMIGMNLNASTFLSSCKNANKIVNEIKKLWFDH